MVQEIYIIDETEELKNKLKTRFKSDRTFRFKQVTSAEIETVLKAIPDLIIINEENIKMPIINACQAIREDEDNSITPLVVVTSNNDKKHEIEIMKQSVEYVIELTKSEDLLYYAIKNITRLLYVNRRISPLTGLPGNVQIQAELKKRILNRDSFAVLYIDLDNFKAYNDIYGFLKGDEIIKLIARIMTKNVHDLDSSDVFAGHIGGDDFVAVVSLDVNYEAICQNIIAEFDIEVLKYFNEVDAERGYLEVQNRKGITEEFPLTSVSIGVVVADSKRFANILEIGEVGAQVKHLAKTAMGSSYAIDRRKDTIGGI